MTSKQLGRTLPSRFVLAVTVGGVIGLGILRGPGEVAAVVPDPALYLSLWFLVGLFVLLSTAVTAELVGMTPRSGGYYALIRRAYGPYPGFVIGWVDWLSFSADLALKAVVIVEFLSILAPQAAGWNKTLAIGITTVFAVVQLRGIGLSAMVQQIATAMIGLLIFALAMLLLVAGSQPDAPVTAVPASNTLNDWSLLIATLIFTYDGWLYASYFSGEIRGGAGAVARSCIKGMVLVIFLYMMLNLALVKSTGLVPLVDSDLALAHALDIAVHPAAGSIVVVAAILILLSHQNLEYLGGPRILHALAVDGLASSYAQRVGKGGNPVVAIVVTWLLAIALILVGGFEFLLLLLVFLFVPIYLALIVGILILRKREPETERPYRAWGHPYSTIFCLLAWSVITAFQAYAEREAALYAAALIAVSWPVYRYGRRHGQPPRSSSDASDNRAEQG